MALDLFCYTSLDLGDADIALGKVKAAGAFDYEADFILSAPMIASEDLQGVASEFSAVLPRTIFLVRLNNKMLTDQDTIGEFVKELRSEFSDLLVLLENERPY